MKIFTTDEELRILIGAAAAEMCKEQIAKEKIGTLNDQIITGVAGILEAKLLNHLTGVAKINEEVIEAARLADKLFYLKRGN